ncbi:MAG: hypothetical protein ACLF0G_01360 [Candidatus Brocadiia bacterium]
MGSRYKFSCTCGQHLVARESMAGTAVKCPVCLGEVRIPRSGETIDESQYEKTERYALVCACGQRILVKAAAAGKQVHCPTCAKRMQIPPLAALRGKETRALETPRMARDQIHTEDLLLLVDDEEGPGTEIS